MRRWRPMLLLGSGVLWLTLAQAGTLGEGPLGGAPPPKPPAYVQLTSDCLTLAIRPALIDSVGAVPEPVKLPSGQESFTLTIQVGVQYYRFCYGTVAARDAAMAQVLKALEG